MMGYWQGIITGAALVGMAVALTAATRSKQVTTLDVERINIREPDGTLRLVISGKDRFPGSFVKGEEMARPDRRHAAGLLFLNDEGTENGGLIWAGNSKDGTINAGASLTFDRYENDQTIQLLQTDSGDRDLAALIISDRPNGSMFESKDGKLAVKPGAAEGPPRLFVGKSRDRASVVMLQDANGIPRLMLRVDPDGTSSIDFIDEKGEVLRSIGPRD
ncbi:hypothetical protein G6N82_01485 [Altererythrobacter sp. BO-6]|uniref:hypothetical protein n=1 Tax=Altererythrobacter sp. BO-6 TaxID=2604537 RepID=UPI0013E1A3E8|nr:hypothetical protein [Altererythrobacter sp. BO-6]QIG53008.1 hypothetical protein G6N82_01485 [Altererythrobacter sp. BO-6]